MLLSYCVVNTDGRERSARLPGRDRAHRARRESSARCWCSTTPPTTARPRRSGRWAATIRLIALERREGKAENDTRLLREARGEYCLLLNEDSELQPGRAAGAARRRSRRTRRRRSPERSCSPPTGEPAALRLAASRAGAPRWPARSSCTARSPCRAAASGPARSAGCSRARCWSAATPPSRSATSTPTSSSTPTRPTSASASRDAGWRILYVPAARPSTTTRWRATRPAPSGASVEFHRNRDLYLRKHKGGARPSCCGRCSPSPTWSATARGAAPRPLTAPLPATPARRCGPEAARESARPPRPSTRRRPGT